MSDTVDNVLNTVSEATESEPSVNMDDVVVNEEAPVASASETEVEEPEPVAEPEPEPVAETAPVSTQEVVQNVQEILSSTETNVSGNDLEERVKVLEERLDKMIEIFKTTMPSNIGELLINI